MVVIWWLAELRVDCGRGGDQWHSVEIYGRSRVSVGKSIALSEKARRKPPVEELFDGTQGVTVICHSTTGIRTK
jgi:hypothetical protein